MPEKFSRNRVDCSQIDDQNPTRLLQAAEPELKEIRSLGFFKGRMTEIIESSTISPKNLRKFKRARDKITTLDEMVMYFYNFILAGSGMQTKFER